MNIASKSKIKALFKKYNLHPSKRLGQNFLVDINVVRKVVKSANLQPEDVVVEIGPGIGILTQQIAKKAKQVVGVEKDPKMIEILRETLRDYKNIRIVNADILKINIANYLTATTNYKVVANLPYYIVSPIIRKFLRNKYPPKEMILIAQKEVAQRICSKPPKMNLLAVSIQLFSKVEIVSYISRKSFFPQPKVDAAIIKIKPSAKKPIKIAGDDLFFEIVEAGFSHPRKQLLNNLVKKLKLNREQVYMWLSKNNISPSQRAETLTVDDWVFLTKTFPKVVD